MHFNCVASNRAEGIGVDTLSCSLTWLTLMRHVDFFQRKLPWGLSRWRGKWGGATPHPSLGGELPMTDWIIGSVDIPSRKKMIAPSSNQGISWLKATIPDWFPVGIPGQHVLFIAALQVSGATKREREREGGRVREWEGTITNANFQVSGWKVRSKDVITAWINYI